MASRREQHGRNDGWLNILGHRLIFEVKLERLFQIGEGLIYCFTLTDHVNIETPGYVPRHFVSYCCSQLHGHIVQWTVTIIPVLVHHRS